MNPINDFAAFEGKIYAATTRRVYLSAAKKAVRIVGKTPEDCESYEELLALLGQNLAEKKLPKAVRITPFLRFLDSKIPKTRPDIPDYGPIRAWVIERIENETRTTREPLHFIRRDLAMLPACAWRRRMVALAAGPRPRCLWLASRADLSENLW